MTNGRKKKKKNSPHNLELWVDPKQTVKSVATAIGHGRTDLGVQFRENHFWEQRESIRCGGMARQPAKPGAGQGAGAGTLSASASSVVVRQSQRAGEMMGMAPTAEGGMPRRVRCMSGGEATGAAARSLCPPMRHLFYVPAVA